MNTNNKQPHRLYKGYFIYYLDGVLKSYNFTDKTAEWLKQHRAGIVARVGAVNCAGEIIRFDRMQTTQEVKLCLV